MGCRDNERLQVGKMAVVEWLGQGVIGGTLSFVVLCLSIGVHFRDYKLGRWGDEWFSGMLRQVSCFGTFVEGKRCWG